MIIAETKDIDLIKSVLCHPEIYERINGDGSPKREDFEPPLDIQYIAGYVDSDIIGLMIYHTVNGRIECHLQVLPEYRQKYARKFARMAFSFGEAKNATIFAEIPECYPEVIRFAKDLNFRKFGTIIEGRSKGGILYDVEILRLENGHS